MQCHQKVCKSRGEGYLSGILGELFASIHVLLVGAHCRLCRNLPVCFLQLNGGICYHSISPLPPVPLPHGPPAPWPPNSAGPRICCTCLWALLSSPLSPCLCFLWLSGGICYHSISRYRKAAWALGPHTKDKSSFHPIHA